MSESVGGISVFGIDSQGRTKAGPSRRPHIGSDDECAAD